MRSILVIHEAVDQPFVEGRLTKPLPALGFDGWQSSLDLEAGSIDGSALAAAIQTSAAILAVVSPATASEAFCARVAQARAAGTPVIIVRVGEVDNKPGDEVWSGLASVTAGGGDEFWSDLAALLPPPPSAAASVKTAAVRRSRAKAPPGAPKHAPLPIGQSAPPPTSMSSGGSASSR